ncbi:MAG: hypothetical protein LQ349_005233 [Xanthoria aureola]|nr:MAG: hypothetical protein LQ349_005233 [Xanthoria aureola]
MASGMPSPGSDADFPVFGREDRSIHPYGRSNGSVVNAFHNIQSEDCMEENLARQDGEPIEKHGKENNKARIVQRRRGRRKSESLLRSLCQFIADHQIGLAANLLALLVMTHVCFPRARHHTRKFWRLSYHSPSSQKYALGWDDSFLVAFWLVVFTGLRAVVMDYILTPLAYLLGLHNQKDKTRFAEQAWVLIYDSTFWSLGMYIMYHSDHWLNLRQLWTNWPDREMRGLFKWYYLVQFAFWVQQIVVVHIEKRRKDHWQMFTHHVITCILMFTSYGYHQSKVGNTILCLMDAVDILFALAKLLKYLNLQTACNITFGVFMLVWFGARHVLYLLVCWSIYADIPKEITYGCYRGASANLEGPSHVPNDFNHLVQPFKDPQGLVCWNNGIKWAFLATLLTLQVILLIWFGMIIRVALKVLKGGEAEDSRSDEEESDEEEIDEEGEKRHFQSGSQRNVSTKGHSLGLRPLEEEVGVESIHLIARNKSPNSIYRKVGSTTSGVHLPSDSKELLGRIGCDKGA